MKQAGKVNYVCFVVTLQKDNYKELPDIAKFAIDLKFDRLDINKIANWGCFTDEEYKQISMYDENGNPKPELEEVLKNPIFKSKEIQFVGNALRINNLK